METGKKSKLETCLQHIRTMRRERKKYWRKYAHHRKSVGKVFEKFLLVLGLLRRLESESTFEVVRHLIGGWGRTKLFF